MNISLGGLDSEQKASLKHWLDDMFEFVCIKDIPGLAWGARDVGSIAISLVVQSGHPSMRTRKDAV